MIPTIRHALLGFCIFGLIACNSESEIQLSDGVLTAPMPERVRQVARLGTVPLELRISVNGDVIRRVPVSNNITANDVVEAIVNVPADQTNEIKLEWFAIPEGTPVVLADVSTVTGPNQETLTVETFSNTESFDFDADGISNLQEVLENRNALGRYDLEVPLQTTFLRARTELVQGTMDADISETEFTLDETSRFSLRHDGTNLHLYLCGQDEVVQFDGADEDPDAYWHDDTVFLYLDGGDSDNENYDGFDDFQIAFVRQTQEKIVSKGGSNSFCPNGDCVTHSFNDPSTTSECVYELNVTMPLADLNITPGTDVGFDLELTDDDDGGLREGSSGFIGFDDDSDTDPSTFGKIILQ